MSNTEFSKLLYSHKNINGVYYLTEVTPEGMEPENTYFKIRKMEGRIYGDAVVAGLPKILSSHPHYKEWLIRKRSAQKLISYISQDSIIIPA